MMCMLYIMLWGWVWVSVILVSLILNVMPATLSKKAGTGACHHCVTSPFLLTTLNKRLGTADGNCWSFVGGILSHSCLMYDSRCSSVQGLDCPFLRFTMRHTFSMVDRTGLQAGQSRTHTLLLRGHTGVTCRTWHCLAEISRGVPEKEVDKPKVYQFEHYISCLCSVFNRI